MSTHASKFNRDYVFININAYNCYLSHRIIDSFLWILKLKDIRLKPVLLTRTSRRRWLTKLVLIL